MMHISNDEFLERLKTRKISKEYIYEWMGVSERFFGDVPLPLLYNNPVRREKYFKTLYMNDPEHATIRKKKFEVYCDIQKELSLLIDQLPGLIQDENGFIHTEFYDSSCMFTDEDVKYKLNLLKELRNEYNDISELYRKKKQEIEKRFLLNMKEDENEIIVRIVDEIFREKKEEKSK